MKAFVLAGLGMLLPAAGFPAVASADTTGSLLGRVRSTEGRPLADAVVIVSSPAQVMRTVSGPNGCYSFVGLRPGMYVVEVMKVGFTPFYQGIVIAAGNQTVADLSMQHDLRVVSFNPGPVSRRLVDAGPTADAYKIDRHNPFFANAQNLGRLLQFVPGVQAGSGGAAIR